MPCAQSHYREGLKVHIKRKNKDIPEDQVESMLPDKKRNIERKTEYKHTCPRCQHATDHRSHLAVHLETVHRLAKADARIETGLQGVPKPKPSSRISKYYIKKAD